MSRAALMNAGRLSIRLESGLRRMTSRLMAKLNEPRATVISTVGVATPSTLRKSFGYQL